MTLNHGNEDQLEITPHIAAIAAAYGDPKGKYLHYLSQVDSSYASQAFWFYDQSAAFSKAPTSTGSHNEHRSVDDSSSPLVAPLYPCETLFSGSQYLELDVGIWVTCALSRPYSA